MTQERPHPRLTREESQAQTRERLVQAARRLFARQGYGGASIRDIAQEAGYSQGAFYSNFASKEAVLLELLRRHMGEEVAHLTAALDPAGNGGDDGGTDDPLAGIRRWSETLNADADWSMLAIELQLNARRSPAFAADYAAVCDGHRAALGRLIGQLFVRLGRVPPAPPDDLAAAFMALAQGLALHNPGGGPHPAGRMILVFLRGLIADAAPA
ncbi:MAG: helix-turn-helix domain containing protein [Azospirillaceae bacterium]|nr:helix-turn-helix domain containing protein [Azospirillaceae bacterium]